MKRNMKSVNAGVLAGIMAVSLLLGGCGKAKTNAWNFTVDDVKYDLSAPFTDFVQLAISEDIDIFEPYTAKAYDEDGELVKVKLLDMDKDKVFVAGTYEDGDLEHVYFTLLDGYGKFRDYESADGINYKSDEDEIPEIFLDMEDKHSPGRILNGVHSYYAIIVDGQYMDLSGYVDDLPRKMSEDDYEEFKEKYRDLGKEAYKVLPTIFLTASFADGTDLMAEYSEDEAVRNAFAIAYAVFDLYDKLQDGEIENFGSVSYSFEDHDLYALDYHLLRTN